MAIAIEQESQFVNLHQLKNSPKYHLRFAPASVGHALITSLKRGLTVSKKVVVVGGGIIGTMHAYLALQKGYSVVQCERDATPQSASMRNFGLIWVSGREAGKELEVALRAREIWGEVGANVPATGFRGNGSLTIARDKAEMGVLEEANSMSDARERGFTLLTRAETEALEPVLAGDFVGSLRCTQDAAAEPKYLLSALREYLRTNDNYQWVPNFEVSDFTHNEAGNHVTDVKGITLSGDLVVFCPGAFHKGFLATYFVDAPVRRVRLQMASTVRLPEKLGHSVADADSLRYYPAFKDLSLNKLPPQSQIAAENFMQLLMVQRLDGTLTIGDTHEYVEPFGHELIETPYEHLSGVISAIFGKSAPAIARRWDGIYSQSTNSDIYFRKTIAPGAVLVTGGGGRGNTISPAIAEETISQWD